MIAYARGIIEDKFDQQLILDVGNMGLDIIISSFCADKLPAKGHEATVLTYLHVREDILQLYGFHDKSERDMFFKLTGISGIGPRQAVNILSALSPAHLTRALLEGDIKAIKRAPGVGDKLARRIVVELKEKISDEETRRLTDSENIPEQKTDMISDALSALNALGYRQSILQAFFKTHTPPAEASSAQDIIKWFLQNNKG